MSLVAMGQCLLKSDWMYLCFAYQALDLYCKVHKEVICSNCLVTRHHDCHTHVEDSS